MIKEVIMYTVICDKCGKDSNEESEYAGWNEKGYALEVAEEADFATIDDNHYCPDCYEWDDEGEIKIKELRKE